MKRIIKNNKRGGAIIPDAVKNGNEHQDLAEDEDCGKYIEDLELGKINEQFLASDLINGEYKSKCDPIFRPEETKTIINKDSLTEKDRYLLKELNSNAKELDMYHKLKESDILIKGTSDEKKKFINDLEILNKLGQGSFGTVNLCKLNSTEEIFALKKIKKDKKPIMEYLIEKEIKILRFLKQGNFCFDNILCFRGHDEDDEYHYILTDYVDDYEMFNEKSKDVDTELIKNIYEVIIKLHKFGVAHLDIKPNNILVNLKTNHVILIDFGASCNSIDDKSLSICPSDKTTFIRTVLYVDFRIATKILTNQKIKMEEFMNADLWAFGVILYEIFFGKHFCEDVWFLPKKTNEKIYFDVYCTDDYINQKKYIIDNFNKIDNFLSNTGIPKMETFFRCRNVNESGILGLKHKFHSLLTRIDTSKTTLNGGKRKSRKNKSKKNKSRRHRKKRN